jgi:hypothetical protein
MAVGASCYIQRYVKFRLFTQLCGAHKNVVVTSPDLGLVEIYHIIYYYSSCVVHM